MFKLLNARDVVALLGVGLISTGAGWIYPPAGFMVPGAFCVLLAVFWRNR